MFRFLIIPLILLGAIAAAAQISATTEDGRKVVLKPDKTWDYAPAPAPRPVSNDEVLFKGFQGDDFIEVAKFLSGMKDSFAKNEFESSLQYQARLKALIEDTKFGNKFLDEIVVLAKTQPSYDADSQEMAAFGTAPYYYGTTNYSLEFGNLRAGYSNPDSYSFNEDSYENFNIKMPPGQAAEAKQWIKIAIFGFPFQIKTIGIGTKISFVKTRIVVFNQATGEIYLDQKTKSSLSLLASAAAGAPAPKAPEAASSPSPSAPATTPSSPSYTPSRDYDTGKKGGCYYINSKGKKVYVDRSKCN